MIAVSITKKFSSIAPFFYILLLLILGLFAFHKTFSLAIFGDEWVVLWNVKNSLVITGRWDSYIDQFIGPGYRLGALMMYFLTESFGTDGKAVYIFSFITRFLAASSLFYFLKRRQCSYPVSFVGAIFFLISPIGIQATDWVKNSVSYISIIFFLFCIDSIYNLRSWKNVLVFSLTFFISIYVNPVRGHGIILTATILLVFQYFFNKTVHKKRIIFSLLCSFVLDFILYKMFFQAGINIPPHPIEKILGAVGATLLPQINYYYVGLLTGTLLLWKRYLFTKRYLFFTLVFHLVVFSTLFGSFFQISSERMFTILGVYFILFMISTFIIELSSHKISEALNTSLSFLLSASFVIAPILVGTLVIDPTHRYFIYSSLSLPLIVAFSLSQNFALKLKEKSISVCITLLLFVVFFQSLKSEVNKMYIGHNQNTDKILWQQLASYFDNYDFKNHTPVVFIDTNNGAVVHDTVTFGFGFHMGYMYKIWVSNINEKERRLPIAVDSLADFNSLLTDGKANQKYIGKGYNLIFPKEDGFYFKIDGLKVSRIKDY